MISLRATLKLAHSLLSNASIEHCLIGGLALACYGSTRATIDLDLLIHEDDKPKAKNLFLQNGFDLHYESEEVLQFTGLGYVDLLIARRPISKSILSDANQNGPEGISFAKAEDIIGLKVQAYKNNPDRKLQDLADIQFLISNIPNLDFHKIKSYADLFGEWNTINEIKNKINS